MLGTRTLALLCLACGVIALPTSLKQGIIIQCPDQDENSTAIPFANPSNCSTFYECDNGVAKLFACPATLYFSSKDRVCTYKKNSDCPNALFSIKLTRDGDDTVDDPTIVCPEDEDNTTSVYYPNLKNCSTFYECSNGKPILLPCPRHQFFSSKFCVCVKPRLSGCTQPDDDDDDDDEGYMAKDNTETISQEDFLEIRAHLDRVSKGKCKKDHGGSNNGDDDDDDDNEK